MFQYSNHIFGNLNQIQDTIHLFNSQLAHKKLVESEINRNFGQFSKSIRQAFQSVKSFIQLKERQIFSDLDSVHEKFLKMKSEQLEGEKKQLSGFENCAIKIQNEEKLYQKDYDKIQ